MRIRLKSSTNFISLGLACLTLSLILMAHSLGITGNDNTALIRARVQTAELVAAQCAPAAAENDVETMIAILRQVCSRNTDLVSAGIRDASGNLVYAFGEHNSTWGTQAAVGSAVSSVKLSVPIVAGKDDWGQAEFCFNNDNTSLPAFIPASIRSFLANPAMRIGLFVGAGGFVCYSIYLRRTLRHLDPSAVIPPRVRVMLDALAEGVLVLDRQGQIAMANESFTRSTGLSQDALPGKKAAALGWTNARSDAPAETIPWVEVLNTGNAVKGAPLGIQLKNAQPDGAEAGAGQSSATSHQRIYSVNATPVLGPDGRVRGALATFDDVTDVERMNLALQESRDEVERQNVQLRLLATTDPLTGCFNRRSFLAEFETQWAKVRSEGGVLGCIMVDIDKFKSINDVFGHGAGDTVLKETARIIIKAAAEVSGMVCRYGGEEFCFLMVGKDLDATAEFAEDLRKRIQDEPWTITPVTASLGVASSNQGAAEVKELLDQADRALYASKRSGRNRVTRWGHLPQEVAARTEPTPDAFIGIMAPQILSEEKTQRGFLALMSALAHRHAPTAMHSRRVTDYCLAASPGLLSPDEAAHLEAAALLHDVGKLGVPDSILLKPGPLTPEEWEVMRSHELVSVDLASSAGVPSEVLCLVAAHHSRFKPQGEVGPEDPNPAMVPLAARLLCIADAFDAMTSNRTYRAAMPRDAAFAELRRCAGDQFDPAVVEHFIAAIERHNVSPLPRAAA